MIAASSSMIRIVINGRSTCLSTEAIAGKHCCWSWYLNMVVGCGEWMGKWVRKREVTFEWLRSFFMLFIFQQLNNCEHDDMKWSLLCFYHFVHITSNCPSKEIWLGQEKLKCPSLKPSTHIPFELLSGKGRQLTPPTRIESNIKKAWKVKKVSNSTKQT